MYNRLLPHTYLLIWQEDKETKCKCAGEQEERGSYVRCTHTSLLHLYNSIIYRWTTDSPSAKVFRQYKNQDQARSHCMINFRSNITYLCRDSKAQNGGLGSTIIISSWTRSTFSLRFTWTSSSPLLLSNLWTFVLPEEPQIQLQAVCLF